MTAKTRAETEIEKKRIWLDEHLPYELKMVRYTYARLASEANLFYLDWNAMLAAFAVSACNLADFLTNKEKQPNNFQASYFVQGFRSRKDNLASAFAKLEPQVFHLGKLRPDSVEGKFSLSDAKAILAWIEEEMSAFLDRLPSEERNFWNEKRAVPDPPEEQKPRYFTAKPGPQSASSADPISVRSSNIEGL